MLADIRDTADLRKLDGPTLRRVADKLRTETIEAVSKTGGHLGSGLGVVELTVALHHVFDTPRDKLIWDVGHQAYPHKILTGRRDRIHTLRSAGGLSGFTKRAESEYDPFGAAHAATSISAALGMCVARDLRKQSHHVIAVIGDGSMSAGMAYEALNNAGSSNSRIIVILNDNEMSIAPPVGAMSAYFTRLGVPNIETAHLQDGLWFEEMGFRYVGPIDGHDLDLLVPALNEIKNDAGPVLLHIKTRKGKGYEPAEASSDRYHGVGKFDVGSGALAKAKSTAPSYTSVFGKSLIAEAAKDDRIVAITAAMPGGTGVDIFAKAYPDRAFDVGIAEQHAVTFAAGLAAEGMKPFCAIYSTFLQRGYDQVVHDVALQSLPVRFAIDRAGLVGPDGPTHAGSFDIAYLACLPGFVIMAAADEAELTHMVATAAGIDDRPSAIRYPRGDGVGVPLPKHGVPLEIGKGRVVREGDEVALLSFGARLAECEKAADALRVYGLSITVADARFAKPLDEALVLKLARDHKLLITIEEGSIGGFGSHVFQCLSDNGALDSSLMVRSMVLPDRFQDHDSPVAMYADAGLDAAGIVSRVLTALGRDKHPTRAKSSSEPLSTARSRRSQSLDVVLAQPRGFCAGVVRAIEIVDQALIKHGAPVYVRHEIVHNRFVVEGLKGRGAIFVDEVADIPRGSVAIFSAHGVGRDVEDAAVERDLIVYNATCPLVAKVHKQGRRYLSQGRTLVLIGHAGHPEVVGTIGQLEGTIYLVQNERDVAGLPIPRNAPVAYITQTTLSVDDTRATIAALNRRFSDLAGPDVRDICYATQNRQVAVRELARQVDAILVVGAKNSSNSNRLREIGEELGVPSYLIADSDDIRLEWLQGVRTLGVTAGASAPEALVEDVINFLGGLGPVQITALKGRPETVEFKLPAQLASM